MARNWIEEMRKKAEEGKTPSSWQEGMRQRAAKAGQAASRDSKDYGVLGNIAAGANDTIADVVDFPSKVGQKLFGGPQVAPSRDLMNQAGIKTDANPELVSTKIGAALPGSVAQSVALIAAAPAMAAAKGSGMLSSLLRSLSSAGASPAYTIGSDMAATTGAVVGQDMAEKVNGKDGVAPAIGALTGGIVGGAALSTLLRGALSISKTAKDATKGISNALGGDPANGLGPIRPSVPTDKWQEFAQTQIDGDLAKVQTLIDDAFKRVAPTKEGQASAELLRERLGAAKKIGRQIEDQYWKRVPETTRISTPSLRSLALEVAQEAKTKDPSVVPSEAIQQILKLTAPRRTKTGATLPAAPIPVSRWLGLRSALLREIRSTVPGQAFNAPLVGNKQRLVTGIEDAIQQALPEDTTIAQARAFSTQFNDLFTRHGVGDVLRQAGAGDFQVDPQRIGTKLFNQPDMKQLAAISDKGLVTPDAVKLKFPQVRAEMEDWIKAQFATLGDQRGPQAAIDWVRKNDKQLSVFSNAFAELSASGDVMAQALAKRAQIEGSAVAKYAKTASPDIPVKKIFASEDPMRDAQQWLKVMKEDPDGNALRGFQASVIDHVFNLSSQNPLGPAAFSSEKFANTIRDPKTRKILLQVLGADKVDRLDKIARLGRMIDNPAMTGARVAARVNPLTLTAIMGARLVGAWMGRQVVPGTIQGPAIFSGMARAYVEKALKATPTQELMVRAVMDPRWERLLEARAPATPAEAVKMGVWIRRLVAVEQGAKALVEGGEADNVEP